MTDLNQRARNAMIGLAIGDASSWTAMYHRSLLLPFWTRRIRREMDAASETTNVIATPMPFSLNQPAEHFDISPTDDTEWAAFSAGLLVGRGTDSYEQTVRTAWTALAQSTDPVRGGVGTQAALHNLRQGIEPPQSGKENPHYFDDGAMPRAVPIGIVCAGDPESAAHLAGIDACVTNSEDGVWAAQAIAAAVSVVCGGGDIETAIDAAHRCLPDSSWIRRTVEEALTIAGKGGSIFSVLPELHHAIVNREYSYGNAAPETLALTLAIARAHGTAFDTALTTSLGFAKSGESLPAMVGALSGGMHDTPIAGDGWLRAVSSLKGICIPSCAGKNYLMLVDACALMGGRKNLS